MAVLSVGVRIAMARWAMVPVMRVVHQCRLWALMVLMTQTLQSLSAVVTTIPVQ